MLKEYRICMPMTVEEYQIGQLYMIARHSAEQSNGGEGVEVIENHPHSDPVHGNGQFTEKKIYISSKLPTWMAAYVPNFIYITEKGWNYYPYTETEYTCSIVPKFSIKIWTRYKNNNGCSDDCFENIPEEVEGERVVDVVDIVTEEVPPHHYKEEEDPNTFVSKKTGRGPLKEGWRDTQDPIMCSYKLVDISFKVFGFQTKVEDFAQRAIRNILLVGHRQAYAWIDEWHGMTIEDVRTYEANMQEETNEKIRETLPMTEGENKQVDNEEQEEEEEIDEKDSSSRKSSKSSTPNTQSPKTPKSPTGSTGSAKGYLSSWFKWS